MNNKKLAVRYHLLSFLDAEGRVVYTEWLDAAEVERLRHGDVSLPAEPTTRAPARLANCPANWPTAPAADEI